MIKASKVRGNAKSGQCSNAWASNHLCQCESGMIECQSLTLPTSQVATVALKVQQHSFGHMGISQVQYNGGVGPPEHMHKEKCKCCSSANVNEKSLNEKSLK